MAFSPNHLVFLLLISLSTLKTEARESRFFSKAAPYNPPKEADPSEPPKQQLAFAPETNNGYGLYGRYYTPSTSTYDAEYNGPTEEYPYADSQKFENIGPTSTYPTQASPAPGVDEKRGSAPKWEENREADSEVGEKREYESFKSYPEAEYDQNQYGMSDTRLVDNGKYFYDIDSNNHFPNMHEEASSRFENRDFYGSNENAYYFNNNYEGGYQGESPEDSEP